MLLCGNENLMNEKNLFTVIMIKSYQLNHMSLLSETAHCQCQHIIAINVMYLLTRFSLPISSGQKNTHGRPMCYIRNWFPADAFHSPDTLMYQTAITPY